METFLAKRDGKFLQFLIFPRRRGIFITHLRNKIFITPSPSKSKIFPTLLQL